MAKATIWGGSLELKLWESIARTWPRGRAGRPPFLEGDSPRGLVRFRFIVKTLPLAVPFILVRVCVRRCFRPSRGWGGSVSSIPCFRAWRWVFPHGFVFAFSCSGATYSDHSSKLTIF